MTERYLPGADGVFRRAEEYDCRLVGEHDRELRQRSIDWFLSGATVGFALAILMGWAS